MIGIKDYYTVDCVSKTEDGAVFAISLNPDCAVYKGHFPSQPISPGVCNINMILECASSFAEKPLLLKEIRQCRLISLITPQTHPQVTLGISMTPDAEHSGAYFLTATITKGEETCMTLKGTVSEYL